MNLIQTKEKWERAPYYNIVLNKVELLKITPKDKFDNKKYQFWIDNQLYDVTFIDYAIITNNFELLVILFSKDLSMISTKIFDLSNVEFIILNNIDLRVFEIIYLTNSLEFSNEFILNIKNEKFKNFLLEQKSKEALAIPIMKELEKENIQYFKDNIEEIKKISSEFIFGDQIKTTLIRHCIINSTFKINHIIEFLIKSGCDIHSKLHVWKHILLKCTDIKIFELLLDYFEPNEIIDVCQNVDSIKYLQVVIKHLKKYNIEYTFTKVEGIQ
jgi:hypothetical protein